MICPKCGKRLEKTPYGWTHLYLLQDIVNHKEGDKLCIYTVKLESENDSKVSSDRTKEAKK